MAQGPRRSNQQSRLSGSSGFVHLPAEATWVRVCYLDPRGRSPAGTLRIPPPLLPSIHISEGDSQARVWWAQHGQENDYWTLLCPLFHISPGQEGREPWGGLWPRGSMTDFVLPESGQVLRWEGPPGGRAEQAEPLLSGTWVLGGKGVVVPRGRISPLAMKET